METNYLKSLIGKGCMAIDPRSKKVPKQFEPGIIERAEVTITNNARQGNPVEVREWLSFTVRLDKITIPSNKNDRRMYPNGYNRCVQVGETTIKLPSAE